MIWITLGIASAFCAASSDLFCKRALEDGLPALALSFWRSLFAIPFLLPVLFWGVPEFHWPFYWLHLIWIPIDVTALFFYFYSVKHAPLSLSVPLSGVVLVVVATCGWVFIGETLTLLTLLGMGAVLVGSYVLNLKPAETGWFGPLRALRHDRGVQAMVLGASLFGLNAVPGKLSILASDPMYMSLHYMMVYSLVLAPIGFQYRKRVNRRMLVRQVLPAGMFFGFMFLTMLGGMYLTNVAHIAALRRFAGPFSVLYGWLLFREHSIRMRAIGSLIILAGAVLIALGGS